MEKCSNRDVMLGDTLRLSNACYTGIPPLDFPTARCPSAHFSQSDSAFIEGVILGSLWYDLRGFHLRE